MLIFIDLPIDSIFQINHKLDVVSLLCLTVILFCGKDRLLILPKLNYNFYFVGLILKTLGGPSCIKTENNKTIRLVCSSLSLLTTA